MLHKRSVGVEQHAEAAAIAHERAPGRLVHEGDFFGWAAETKERFDCAAGNPPFIRYQRFAGSTRKAALTLASKVGAEFSALTSSWAPFLVATASLLRPGGRMAFVVPAEIGHSTYSVPLLDYLVDHFGTVQVVVVKEKLFTDLSEDVWLLFVDRFGEKATELGLTVLDTFEFSPDPPSVTARIPLSEWKAWNGRLRPFLLSAAVRQMYRALIDSGETVALSDVAKVGIGYVTGANDFFHLRPSDVAKRGIPRRLVVPAVRNGRVLREPAVTKETVKRWLKNDEPALLLRLRPDLELPSEVRQYLATDAARSARETYKCRNRSPWYVVPDVTVPDGFMAYMSGGSPALVANEAKCVGTNSVHTVTALRRGFPFSRIQRAWSHPVARLSCEIEGHPLGGGMLKLEPREAGRVRLPLETFPDAAIASRAVEEAVATLREWRHCAP